MANPEHLKILKQGSSQNGSLRSWTMFMTYTQHVAGGNMTILCPKCKSPTTVYYGDKIKNENGY